MPIYRDLLVLEHKTRGRQPHLAKCFGPKGPSSVAKTGYKANHDLLCTLHVSTPCFYTHLHTAHCNQSCDHSVGTVESHTPYSIAIGIHATVSRSNV